MTLLVTSLISLPSELLLKVFEYLPDPETAARLGQSNKRLHETWTAEVDNIISQILVPQIPGFNEALQYATAERTLSLKRLRVEESIRMKGLLSRLRGSSKVFARVNKLFGEHRVGKPWDGSWNAESIARGFYMSGLLVLAYEHPSLRRDVRRKIKRISENDLEGQRQLILWLICDLLDQDIREWLNLDVSEEEDPQLEFRDWDSPVHDRWSFTLDTTVFYEGQERNAGRHIGEQGRWTNASGRGFQSSWW